MNGRCAVSGRAGEAVALLPSKNLDEEGAGAQRKRIPALQKSHGGSMNSGCARRLSADTRI